MLSRAHEQGSEVTVIMADLDKFKSINDDFGHLTGDEVIRAFGVACRQSVRSRDLVGRFGGEEFIMALADSSAADGVAVAERIQFVLSAQRILLDGHTVPTASFGVADSSVHGDDLGALIASADTALYGAKSAGRNCVMVSGAAPLE
ncbi:GGDEF domain-containing protein [Sinomonas atrocyanea]